MAFVAREFNSAQELTDYLNDVILGKALPAQSYNLDGLTLILTNGSGAQTTTFSGTELTPNQIIDQITAAHASMVGVVTLRNNGTGGNVLAIVTDGAILDKGGTANAALGLPTAANRTVGANAVALASIASITKSGPSKFTVIHE